MANKESAITFPCDFPIKVFGKASTTFETEVISIFNKHVPQLGENAVKIRNSNKGKYAALTVVIKASSQEQLDALYIELNAAPTVLMVL